MYASYLMWHFCLFVAKKSKNSKKKKKQEKEKKKKKKVIFESCQDIFQWCSWEKN